MTPDILKEWIKEKEIGKSSMVGHDMSGMHKMHGQVMSGEKEKEQEGHRGDTGSNDMAGHGDMNHEDHVHHMSMEKETENGKEISRHYHETHAMPEHDHMHHGKHNHHLGSGDDGQSKTLDAEHQHRHQVTAEHDHLSQMNMENGNSAPSHDHTGHMQHGASGHDMPHMNHDMSNDPHMFNMMRDRPMFATVTVAVCHCGAGCLLGDIV